MQPQSNDNLEQMQGGMDQQQNLVADIEEHLSQLSSEQQQYIAEFMVPETAVLLSLFLGQEYLNYFLDMSDNSRTLVSVPRAEVQSQQQAQPNTMPQATPEMTGNAEGMVQPQAQGLMTPNTQRPL